MKIQLSKLLKKLTALCLFAAMLAQLPFAQAIHEGYSRASRGQ